MNECLEFLFAVGLATSCCLYVFADNIGDDHMINQIVNNNESNQLSRLWCLKPFVLEQNAVKYFKDIGVNFATLDKGDESAVNKNKNQTKKLIKKKKKIAKSKKVIKKKNFVMELDD